MGLAPGTTLGPFEVLSLLGAGGMGEVYRARDTRLSREVAIKVLPAELASDTSRLKRFEKEALSASSLNHPNIVTIHEIGRENGTSFIAMELVEGKTLRALFSREPLPTKRLLAIATQIADGLAKAHASGIVHRDLKPENVMVTSDGHVKILDFGLAKLTRPEADSDPELTQSPTLTATTGAGVVMGTVGYMSPEQAMGRPADFRSDQFSLGAVLYEMATGKRAFARETAPEVLSAIIRAEPEPIAAANPQAPAPLRWIVERCLAKDPDDRFASTRDLARDLASLRDHVSEASLPAVATGPKASVVVRWRRLAVGALAFSAVATVVAAAAAYRLATNRTPVPTYKRLTFRTGVLNGARFAPDGQTVVYTAAWDGKLTGELFTTRVDDITSRPLGLAGSYVLSVSRSAELAILQLPGSLLVGFKEGSGTLARLPFGGGVPRALLENVQSADWAPDGENLAVQFSDRVEYPIGKVLARGDLGWARVSPDGERVASSRRKDGVWSLFVVDRSGKEKVLSTRCDGGICAWRPKGDEIWFTTGGGELWAADLSGRERLVTRVPGSAELHDISRDGKVLVGINSGKSGIMCLSSGEGRERDVGWLESSHVVDLSADGKTVIFNETGAGAGSRPGVYMRGTDGSPAVRLGDGLAAGLSPDGKWVLAFATDDTSRLLIIPTGAGSARTIATRGLQLQQGTRGRWLPDGKSVVVSAGGQSNSRFVVLPIDGGEPRPITPEGMGGSPVLSADGKVVAGLAPDGRITLYPLGGGEPRAVPGTEGAEEPYEFSADGRSLYVSEARVPEPVFRIDVASGRREPWKELMPADPVGVLRFGRAVIALDGRSYAYTYYRAKSSDLYVVDGLR